MRRSRQRLRQRAKTSKKKAQKGLTNSGESHEPEESKNDRPGDEALQEVEIGQCCNRGLGLRLALRGRVTATVYLANLVPLGMVFDRLATVLAKGKRPQFIPNSGWKIPLRVEKIGVLESLDCFANSLLSMLFISLQKFLAQALQ